MFTILTPSFTTICRMRLIVVIIFIMNVLRGLCFKGLRRSQFTFGRSYQRYFSSSTAPSQLHDYFSIDSKSNNIQFGDYSLIASQSVTDRKFTSADCIGTEKGIQPGEIIWIRARIANVRAKGNACFIVLRSNSFYTIQAVHFKDKANPDDSKRLISFASGLTEESIVDIMGEVVKADVISCTQHNVELYIKKLFVVSRAPAMLPFQLDAAARSEKDIEESLGTESPYHGVSQVSTIT